MEMCRHPRNTVYLLCTAEGIRQFSSSDGGGGSLQRESVCQAAVTQGEEAEVGRYFLAYTVNICTQARGGLWQMAGFCIGDLDMLLSIKDIHTRLYPLSTGSDTGDREVDCMYEQPILSEIV